MRLDSAYTALKLTHDRYVLNQVKKYLGFQLPKLFYILKKGAHKKLKVLNF